MSRAAVCGSPNITHAKMGMLGFTRKPGTGMLSDPRGGVGMGRPCLLGSKEFVRVLDHHGSCWSLLLLWKIRSRACHLSSVL